MLDYLLSLKLKLGKVNGNILSPKLLPNGRLIVENNKDGRYFDYPKPAVSLPVISVN